MGTKASQIMQVVYMAKPDELALVEVLGDLARLHCVHSADDDEQDVVDEGHEEGDVVAGALEDDDGLSGVWGVEASPRGLHQQPDGGKEHLHHYQHTSHHNLRLGANERGPLGRAPRALEYP